jgi:lysophospholipase L1-like esterase
MAAKAEDTRFQNLTVDHHKIMNLAPARRVELLDSSEGRSMLSSLTPQQLQSSFPYQYGRDDATGQKLKSITTGKAQEPQPGDKSGVDATVKNNLGGGRGRSDPGAKAQLSKEQRETLDLLQKGEIAADDPRVGFLKEISEADLTKSGIKINKNDKGEVQSFSRSQIDVSQDDIEVARKSSVSGKNNKQVVMQAFADELRKKGVPPENLSFAVAALAGQVQAESKFNPTVEHDRDRRTGQFTGYGIYGARDPSPGRGRKTDMLNWLEKNGYDKSSAEGQARFMVTEAFSGKYPQSANALKNANKDNLAGVTSVLVDEFEAPAERRQNKIDRLDHTQKNLSEAQMATNGVIGGSNASDDQIKEEIVRRKRTEQDQNLAGTLGRQQQASAADVTVNRKSDTQAKVYYAGDSIGVGVGTAAGGVKLAQSGLKFTDPSVLQQLAKVPKGSTVELHGGTNDAVAGIKDPDVYREQMKRIAELAKANGITVNVNGPPKTRKNWDANAEATDSAMAAAAQEHGVSYRSLRQYTPSDKSDGVHFDNNGYQAMVRPLALPEQQAQTETQPVPSMPDGGEMETSADQLQVYALDKNKLQRDDSIALDGDGKPQFTMNSKESMKFDPNTGKVEVDNGAKGYKNDPNKLGPESQQSQSEKTLEERSVPQATQPQAPVLPTSSNDSGGHNSMYESVNLTQNIFKSPSFERAVARTRFQNTGDTTLGGHFDGGAYGMV